MTNAQQQRLFSSGQLLPIAKAAKGTPYSAEYLSLLARTGKIWAIKPSRDWLTTKSVVLDYIKKQELKHRRKLERLQAVLEEERV